MSVFYLDDQDIWVDHSTPDKLEVRYYKDTGVGCSKGGDSDYSFAWVAPPKAISTGSEIVDRHCLSPEDMDSVVLARVELTEGLLQTYLMAMDGSYQQALEQQVVNWKFKLPGSQTGGVQHRQSLADIVQLEREIYDGITIKTKLLRESKNRRVKEIFGKVKDTLSIQVKPKDGGNDRIMAWIKNMPWADLSRVRPLPSGKRKQKCTSHTSIRCQSTTTTPTSRTKLDSAVIEIKDIREIPTALRHVRQQHRGNPLQSDCSLIPAAASPGASCSPRRSRG